MSRNALIAIIIAIIIVIGAAIAFTRGGGETTTPATGTTTQSPTPSKMRLVIAIPEEPEGLDIQQITWSNEVHDLIYEPLVILDPNMNIVPAQAVSFKVVDNGRAIIFNLPKGAKFANGDPLNATAIKESIERYRRISPYAEDFAVVDHIEILNETAVKIVCKEPPAYLWAVLVTAYGAPVDVFLAKKIGDDAFNREAVGAGPYRIEEWVQGSYILLVRNENYSTNMPFVENKGPPYIDEVMIKFIPEDLTRIMELLSGKVHVVRDVPIDMLDEVKKNPDIKLYETLTPGINYIAVNMKDPILSDINVRKAIMIAIDRNQLVETLKNTAVPWYSLLSPTVIGYDKEAEEWAEQVYAHDADKAKQLLEQAGWIDTDGDGVREKNGQELEITLMVPNDIPVLKKIAPVLQAQLQSIGFKVKLKEMENAFIRKSIRDWDFQLALQRYVWADADILIYLLHSKVANRTYTNPQVDQLLDKARTIMDPVERAKTYTQIQKLALEDLPMIPLFVTKSYTAVRKEVQGVIVLPPYSQVIINDAKIVKG